MWSLLKVLAVIMISIVPGIIIYRFIIKRQFLEYDKSVNGRLIVMGGIGIILSRIVEYSLLLCDIGVNNSIYLSSFISQGINIGILYFLIIRVKHYINKYDIVIYSVSIGIGCNVAATLLNAALNGIFDSLVQAFSYSLIQVTYQIFIAYWIIKSVQSKNLFLKISAVAVSLIMPSLAQIMYLIAYLKESPLVLITQGGVETLSYIIAFYMLRKIAMENVKFESVDPTKIYESSQKRRSIIQKVSYKFDIIMSYGNIAVTMVLFLVGGVLASIAALIIYINAPKEVGNSIFSAIWLSFMRVLDPGNVASDIASGNTIFVIATIFTTLAGLILMSSLIGIISSGFDKRLERLRNGNSKVLERNHILFLGFNEEVISMMNNLSNENKNKRRLKVVILSEKERNYVENEVFENLINPLEFKVICRKGNAWDKEVLYNVSATEAEKIIILGDDDKLVIKSAVAVKRIMETNKCHGISTFALIDSGENVHKAKKILGDDIKVICSQEIESFPLERTLECRDYLGVYSDLTSVVREDIIGTENVKKAIGKTFGDLVNNFWHTCPIGIVKGDEILINPDRDTVIEGGDRIVFIRGKRDMIKFRRNGKRKNNIELKEIQGDQSEIIREILVIGDSHIKEGIVKRLESKAKITQYDDLDEIEIDREIRSNRFQMVIVLGNKELSMEDNDGEVLEKVFYIDAVKRENSCKLAVVCCLNDEVNIEFAYEHNMVEHVITGDNYRLLANEIIQENNLLRRVEGALFQFHKGVDVINISCFNMTGRIKVYDFAEEINNYGMLCIGYILKSEDGTERVINPNLNDYIELKDGDMAIVVK